MKTIGKSNYAIGFFCLLFLHPSAFATPIINPGTISLVANKHEQTDALHVSGGDRVQGLNLNLSVENGGPDFSNDGKLAPRITAVDVLNGTIFADNNDGQTTIASFPQAWVVSTATNTATVPADGVLAWITFDTTGFDIDTGPFAFSLADPIGTPTDFAGIEANISTGQIQISFVPEPTSRMYIAIGAFTALFWRRQNLG